MRKEQNNLIPAVMRGLCHSGLFIAELRPLNPVILRYSPLNPGIHVRFLPVLPLFPAVFYQKEQKVMFLAVLSRNDIHDSFDTFGHSEIYHRRRAWINVGFVTTDGLLPG